MLSTLIKQLKAKYVAALIFYFFRFQHFFLTMYYELIKLWMDQVVLWIKYWWCSDFVVLINGLSAQSVFSISKISLIRLIERPKMGTFYIFEPLKVHTSEVNISLIRLILIMQNPEYLSEWLEKWTFGMGSNPRRFVICLLFFFH